MDMIQSEFEGLLPRLRFEFSGLDNIVPLVMDDSVVCDGVLCSPGPDSGVAAVPGMEITGFFFSHLVDGQRFDDVPALWFVIPGFDAPRSWLDHFDARCRRQLSQILGDVDEVLETREHRISDDLVALVPQHPDPRTNAAHQSWRADAARHFLLLGGIEPDRATVVASTLRCPHPLAWSWSGSSSYLPKPFTGG